MLPFVLTILIAILAVLLILVVLIQNPKGGGVNSTFGGGQAANQIMGAAKSGDFLEKVTWTLAGSILCLTLISGIAFKSTTNNNGTAIDTKGETTTQPVNQQNSGQELSK